MSYNNIRKKLNKYAEGGKVIPKYLTPFGGILSLGVTQGTFEQQMKQKELRKQWGNALGIAPEDLDAFSDDELRLQYIAVTSGTSGKNSPTVNINAPDQVDDTDEIGESINNLEKLQKAIGVTNAAFGALGFEPVTVTEQKTDKDGNKKGLSEGGLMAAGIISQGVAKASEALDQALMGDKNFSSSSLAIDSAVHGASGALMKSGNPYAMIAGAALEGVNFLTKAFGKTVQGYDVGIDNSGYGTLSHMESESGRIWDNMSGKLAKRNEQVRMALAAADISEDQKYEQEARANSVTNVLQQNQIALAGGIDTSLLGS